MITFMEKKKASRFTEPPMADQHGRSYFYLFLYQTIVVMSIDFTTINLAYGGQKI